MSAWEEILVEIVFWEEEELGDIIWEDTCCLNYIRKLLFTFEECIFLHKRNLK